jgi:hypothetical protein
MPPTRTRWKPPVWLIVVDALGLLALGSGLFIHYNPHSALATGPAAALKWPLIVAAVPLLLVGWVSALRLALAHRRGS